ncbi:unnamed protein product [Victoria cruziana]
MAMLSSSLLSATTTNTNTATILSLSTHSTIRTCPSVLLSPLPVLFLRQRSRPYLLRTIVARSARESFYPSPSEDEPPEAPEDTAHGVSRFQQVARQASRARKLQEEQYEKEESIFLSALDNTPDNPRLRDPPSVDDLGDDIFSEIDRAIALKRQEFVEKGLINPSPQSKQDAAAEIDELSSEEAVDVNEISELQDLTFSSDDTQESEFEDAEVVSSIRASSSSSSSLNSSSFDLDFSNLDRNEVRIVEPSFSMSLAQLLDESRVVPVSVSGNLDVLIRGIQHDSGEVTAGDLFVCCVGIETDGHLNLNEADKRGAVAVVANKEISIDETLGCKALVIVEDTNSVLPRLSSCFYGNPSEKMSVIGITGTNGKTTTSYLVRAIYESMALRTGLIGTIAHYVHGNNQLESKNTTPDAVTLQKLMAKMVRNGTEALVMEVSSHSLQQNRCENVDFDIAVFTNLTRDHADFHKTEEDHREAKAELFRKMVDPERHRKVVNLDDPTAAYFVSQGNKDVPVVTFAMENSAADVYAVKFDLSLFETQVLINTPRGTLEISSGLLGRHNVYNILAAVSVGIAVGAPLEDIVRGIEEVDAVPGRCELIDEEQAFAVIVDYAHTPDALSRLLDTVRELGPRRIITVFGCAGESDRGKRPVMAKIATNKSEVVILTSDNPKNEDPLDILDDMLAGVGWTMQDYLRHGENDYYPPLPNGHRLFLHDIRRVAVRAAVAMGEEGDIVVVAGKGHQTDQLEGDKKEFFDDREECREALQYVDELHQAGIDTSEFPWR